MTKNMKSLIIGDRGEVGGGRGNDGGRGVKGGIGEGSEGGTD